MIIVFRTKVFVCLVGLICKDILCSFYDPGLLARSSSPSRTLSSGFPGAPAYSFRAAPSSRSLSSCAKTLQSLLRSLSTSSFFSAIKWIGCRLLSQLMADYYQGLRTAPLDLLQVQQTCASPQSQRQWGQAYRLHHQRHICHRRFFRKVALPFFSLGLCGFEHRYLHFLDPYARPSWKVVGDISTASHVGK